MTPLPSVSSSSAPLEKSMMIQDSSYLRFVEKVDKALVVAPDWVKQQIESVERMLNDIPKEPTDANLAFTRYGNPFIECECTNKGYKLLLRLRPKKTLDNLPLQINPPSTKSSSSSELYPFAMGQELRDERNRRKHVVRETITRDDSMIEESDDSKTSET